ncbi:hypothetical protein NDU88_001418 [Pleurodeles waltl]|uniref:Uncharacterized protein n=1 Tax=Pleurodeles waltl TaxID=8319 RepID=A0AAV7MKX9_PLEWA|nr:hypothetical protein NDU88_001418 [Pleurodeles waltl]
MFSYYNICDYDPQSLSVEELQSNNEFLEVLLPQTGENVPNSESAFATSAQDIYSQEKTVNSLPHASASQVHLQDSAKTKNPDTVHEATLGIPLFSVECFSPSRPVSQNSKCCADSCKALPVTQCFQVSRIEPVSNGSVKTVGFLSSTQKACALLKPDDNTPVSIPKSSAKPFSILSGFDNNMDIHTLKEQFWQIKRQISDFYDEYVITYTRNLARGLFSSMHISLLPEPDILFICKVEEVTEQLMETTARQFENLKKENNHQLWLKEQYATSCASPKTAIKQIFPAMNECQKTAPVINISASSSDSLSACSFPENIPVQLTESLTSLRDLTPLDSKDGSESSEGSVSAPLSEQIKPKEEESSDADSNSCTLRNQDMTFLEINGKLCNSVEESESSDDSGSCLAVNKPADSAVQMAHTPEFSDCGDTPDLSNNIIEFSDNEETVHVSSELMDFSDHDEIPAITKNVMDFSESLKISSVSKQTMENSDKEESQQSETKQPVIRNESLLLELDTVATSTTDPDLLIPVNVYPVSSSTISEEQISELPVSDLDVKSATPTSPAVSLKLKTPENQQSETEAQVLKDIIFPTKTKDLNLNLVFEDLMISTVLSVLLQETIINSKARAENVDTNVKAISEETPVLFLSKEQPFSVNRVEDQLPVVETLCKETIFDTTNTPESTCNEEISVLSEDHPKELACGTSTFSDVNPVSKDLKTLIAPECDTPKSSKMKDNSDFFMFTLRTPVTHVSQVSMLCNPQTTINANTAAETDISCLSEGVTNLTVTNTPIISSKEDSTEQETKVLKNTAHNAIPDILAPESTSPETNSMHSSSITQTIKRKDIGAHMGINTCSAHWKFHLWQDCKLINQGALLVSCPLGSPAASLSLPCYCVGSPSFQVSGEAVALLLSPVCGAQVSTRAPRVESAARPRPLSQGKGRGDAPGSSGPTAGPELCRRGSAPHLRGVRPLFCPQPAAEPRQVRYRLRPAPPAVLSSGSGPGPPVRVPGSPLTALGRRHLVRRPSLTARIFRPLGGVRAFRRSVQFGPYGPRHPRRVISDDDRGPGRLLWDGRRPPGAPRYACCSIGLKPRPRAASNPMDFPGYRATFSSKAPGAYDPAGPGCIH